jgi:drug/metabolite transporter (DMT)-like permease
VSPLVIGVVLFAALMNVTWHVVVKTSGDPLLMTARATGGSIVLLTPFVAAAWILAGRPGLTTEGWLLAVLSGVVELGYFVTLSAAYRRGDLSTVYPIARGTAALGAVFAGIVLLGERPDALALCGIALLVAGGWFVRRPAALHARSSAAGWALLTGLTITTYSAVDAVGSRQGPPWLYGWAMFAIGAALLAGWVLVDARTGFTARIARRAVAGGGIAARLAAGPPSGHVASSAPPPPSAVVVATVGDPAEAGIPVTGQGPDRDAPPAPWGRAIVAGVLITLAYFLVLWAYSVAPLAIVSPLRESAVVLATAWGILGLGEREGATERIGGAILIALGGVLVAVG